MNGWYGEDGLPVIRCLVRVRGGEEFETLMTLATGAAKTILGPEDAAKLGPEIWRETGGPADQPYWRYRGGRVRELEAALKLGDSPERELRILAAEPTEKGEKGRSYLGMDLLRGWEITLNPRDGKVSLVDMSGPASVTEAFSVMTWDSDGPITGEEFLRLADERMGLERIHEYRQGRRTEPLLWERQGRTLELHIESCLSPNGQVQVRLSAVDPAAGPVASCRLSWADSAPGGLRKQEEIRERMAGADAEEALHNRAMELASEAEQAKRAGNGEMARRLFGEALALKLEVIKGMRETGRTDWAALHRSAAWLALKSGQQEKALELAGRALAGGTDRWNRPVDGPGDGEDTQAG